jgi:hypothetical protein
VALAAIQLAQTGYVVTKRVDAAGGAGTLADWVWVDDHVGDAKVAVYAVGIANGSVYDLPWREISFFNRRLESMVAPGSVNLQIPRYGEVTAVRVDERTGRLLTTGGGAIPRYFLKPTIAPTQGLLAETVSRSRYLPVELVRLRGEPRVTFEFTGGEVDGWLSARERSGTIRILPPALAAARRPCLQVTLLGPPAAYVRGPARYVVAAPGIRRAGTIAPDGRARVSVPLTRRTNRIRITASRFGAEAPDGRRLAIRVTDTDVAACDG